MYLKSKKKTKKFQKEKQSNQSKRAGKQQVSLIDVEQENIEGDNLCIICDEFGVKEMWYRCRQCGFWAHA